MDQDESPRNWWLASVASTTALIVLLLLSLKCWRYAPIGKAVAFVTLPPLLLFVFVLLRWTGRVILTVSIMVCGFLFLSPHLNPVPAAQAESSAVSALLQMQSSLQGETIADGRGGFKERLPNVATRFPVPRFYVFEYHPKSLPDRTSAAFEITATVTPGARSCGCVRSFMITPRGDVHYTSEARMATVNDQVVDVPGALKNDLSTR